MSKQSIYRRSPYRSQPGRRLLLGQNLVVLKLKLLELLLLVLLDNHQVMRQR